MDKTFKLRRKYHIRKDYTKHECKHKIVKGFTHHLCHPLISSGIIRWKNLCGYIIKFLFCLTKLLSFKICKEYYSPLPVNPIYYTRTPSLLSKLCWITQQAFHSLTLHIFFLYHRDL